MIDVVGMTKHGIETSAAHYWAHLHPIERRVYWYSVSICRKFIRRENLNIVFASSKDGTPRTGAGYLLPKSAIFVHRAAVAPEYLDYDWSHMTDREAGIAGQEVVEVFA